VILGLLFIASLSLFTGLKLFAHIPENLKGPGPLYRQEQSLNDLLDFKQINTYSTPQGILASITHHIWPELTFLTPPNKSLRDGLIRQVALALVATISFLLAPLFGYTSILFFLVAMIALGIRYLALQAAVVPLKDSEPSIEVFESTEHIHQAGNPVDFFLRLENLFQTFRDRGFPNRVFALNAPEARNMATSNKCDAFIFLETQPIPLSGVRNGTRTVQILELGGVILKSIGFALLLLSVPILISFKVDFLYAVFSAITAFESGWNFRALAHSLACSFRFRSDIFRVSITGSYTIQEISLGGSDHLVSTKGQVIKSDLMATIMGTRLISECSLPSYSYRHVLAGNSNLVRKVIEKSPRHILSCELDEGYTERLALLIDFLRNYRDKTDQLRTPNLQSEASADLISQNLTIAQLVAAAKSRGWVMGGKSAADLQNPEPVKQVSFDTQTDEFNFTAADAQDADEHVQRPKVRWRCPFCASKLRISSRKSGAEIRCPKCQRKQIVPSSTD
jgi:hypothetical protein